MMKASRLSVLVVLLGLALPVLPACAPVYVPNTVHAPMLEERGDIQVGGYAGTSGIDLQAAAALTDHVGAFADFSFGNQEGDADDPANDDDFHRHRFGEVGIGYFTELGRVGHFEVYGGYGLGQAEAADEYQFISPGLVTATGRYTRFFVQPAVGVDVGPLRVNGAARLVRVNFYEFETSSLTVSEDQTAFFVEPAVGLSLGTGTVRFGTQVGMSRVLPDADDNVAFDYQPLWFSIGMQLKLNPLLR